MAKQIVRRTDGLLAEPAGRGIYATAIRSKGDFVFMMGQGGYDFDGYFVGAGDAGLQAEQACKNILKLLAEVGGDIVDLCKLTVYLTDISHRHTVYTTIENSFRGGTFCRTGVVVTSLGPPELLVKIDAFAVIGRRELRRRPVPSTAGR
jgi:enamine deaminase RidA (YjgF/YER057c/UK114 family)